jgi:hypothetical protein
VYLLCFFFFFFSISFFLFYFLCDDVVCLLPGAPAAPATRIDNAFDVNAMKTEPLSCALKMSRCSSLSLSLSLLFFHCPFNMKFDFPFWVSWGTWANQKSSIQQERTTGEMGGVPAGTFFQCTELQVCVCVYLGANPPTLLAGLQIKLYRRFSYVCVCIETCDWLPVGHVLRSGGWWWVGFRKKPSRRRIPPSSPSIFFFLFRIPPLGARVASSLAPVAAVALQ